MMPYTNQTPVMDVTPWPDGHGFKGADVWWNHVLSKEECKRLDNLMGLALLDEDIRIRLLKDRDSSLFTAFRLAPETQAWLRTINVSTLAEFAEAIVAGPHYSSLDQAS
jgi:hypothetical protein